MIEADYIIGCVTCFFETTAKVNSAIEVNSIAILKSSLTVEYTIHFDISRQLIIEIPVKTWPMIEVVCCVNIMSKR